MNRLITGIFSALLVAGIMGMYLPHANASIIGDPESCTGNAALAQDGSNSAEQNPLQEQASDFGAQSISPEFNALTGNNLNFNDQQNGECGFDREPIPQIGQPGPIGPVGDELPEVATSTASQNVTE